MLFVPPAVNAPLREGQLRVVAREIVRLRRLDVTPKAWLVRGTGRVGRGLRRRGRRERTRLYNNITKHSNTVY